MSRVLLLFCALFFADYASAKFLEKPVYSGMYLQWGYNRDRYTRSTIHFWEEGKYDFTIHNAMARDKPDFQAFRQHPGDITIPQNSLRIGVYLNKKHTHAIEFNFDHAKYVLPKNQRVHLTGTIAPGGEYYDKDTTLYPGFISFEHTNGANFTMLNYVGQSELLHNKKRTLATCVYKVGGGIVVPRSDVRLRGKRMDNVYHVAGYIFGLEGGLRFYPLKNVFLEATAKGGFANYCNVLTVDEGKASHHFFFGEVIGLVGVDLNTPDWFRKKKKTTEQ